MRAAEMSSQNKEKTERLLIHWDNAQNERKWEPGLLDRLFDKNVEFGKKLNIPKLSTRNYWYQILQNVSTMWKKLSDDTMFIFNHVQLKYFLYL